MELGRKVFIVLKAIVAMVVDVSVSHLELPFIERLYEHD